MLTNLLKNSIVAFKGSSNCNIESPETFYDSYILRKKKIIEGKMYAENKGSRINYRKLNKENILLHEAEKFPEEVKQFIKEYFYERKLI